MKPRHEVVSSGIGTDTFIQLGTITDRIQQTFGRAQGVFLKLKDNVDFALGSMGPFQINTRGNINWSTICFGFVRGK